MEPRTLSNEGVRLISKVDWHFQKEAATAAVRRLTGLISVTIALGQGMR